jgi:hypothetical protein
MVGFSRTKMFRMMPFSESSRSMRTSSKYAVFHSELKSRSMEIGS